MIAAIDHSDHMGIVYSGGPFIYAYSGRQVSSARFSSSIFNFLSTSIFLHFQKKVRQKFFILVVFVLFWHFLNFLFLILHLAKARVYKLCAHAF